MIGAEEGRTIGGWGYVEAGRITNYILMLSFLISVLWPVKWLTLTRLRSFRHAKIKFHSQTSNPFRRTFQKFQLYHVLHTSSMRQLRIGLFMCITCVCKR